MLFLLISLFMDASGDAQTGTGDCVYRVQEQNPQPCATANNENCPACNDPWGCGIQRWKTYSGETVFQAWSSQIPPLGDRYQNELVDCYEEGWCRISDPLFYQQCQVGPGTGILAFCREVSGNFACTACLPTYVDADERIVTARLILCEPGL
jgi:hypothetical protein